MLSSVGKGFVSGFEAGCEANHERLRKNCCRHTQHYGKVLLQVLQYNTRNMKAAFVAGSKIPNSKWGDYTRE
jgi:hypothetical protein